MKTIKNIISAIKEITSVSKTIIPIISLFVLLSSFTTIVDLFLIRFIINYAFSADFNISTLLLFLLFYFLLVTISKTFLDIGIKAFLRKFESKLKSQINSNLYKKISEIDIINYNNMDFYNKISIALQESDTRYFTVLMQLFSFITSLVIFGSIFSIYNDPIIIIASVVSAFNYIIYFTLANKFKYRYDKNERPFFRYGEYLDRVFYDKEYSQELRINDGIKKILQDNFMERNHQYLVSFRRYLNRFAKKTILMSTMNSLIFCFASVYFSIKVLNSEVSVGDFVIILNIVSSASSQIINVLKVVPEIYQSGLYINDINEVINFQSAFNMSKVNDVIEFKIIKFENVYFSYSEKSVFVIHDLNFDIKKNDVIAIVGLNGSGKSTIIDLILSLIKPNKGKITINGNSYEEYNVKNLRALFSVIFQDFQVYETSVAENILTYEPSSQADRDLVIDSLKYADLYERVMAMDNEIDTVISSEENAVGLSGGERQRIAIARAYSQKRPILVFDEPTSALDIYAADLFYSKLINLSRTQNKTIIYTTHNLRYAALADKILFVENGTVSAIGNHSQLIKENKNYSYLYQLQTKDFFGEKGNRYELNIT